MVQKFLARVRETPDGLERKIGKWVTDDDYQHLDRSCDVYTAEGDILLKLRRKRLRPSDAAKYYDIIRGAAGATHNRPIAAGPKKWVNSRPIGVTERGVTAWTKHNPEAWMSVAPLLRLADAEYAKLAPSEHKQQLKAAKAAGAACFGTAFSTVTVNRGFRTAMHTDSNNYEAGLAVMTLLKGGMDHGGRLLFPEYHISVTLEVGDFIVYDVTQWHCNSPLNQDDRLSCVFYLRQDLVS